ncbi:uncharacterized protein LOC135389622 [Ornithodoros turicata]|uniref:uncharacterized protein LOC135389622 n=1 Tax=Ornithodoros turicata TaxID=34597 RepID=UPI003138A921
MEDAWPSNGLAHEVRKTKRKSTSHRYCCVFKCHRREGVDENVKFYRFPSKPYERDRRRRWINAVRRVSPDGEAWEPTENTRICSLHFVGNQSSNIEKHPGYIPTLFPRDYLMQEPKVPQDSLSRFKRWNGRHISTVARQQSEQQLENSETYSSIDTCCDTPGYDAYDLNPACEKETQTEPRGDVCWRLTLFLGISEDGCASTMVSHAALQDSSHLTKPSTSSHSVGPDARDCVFLGCDSAFATKRAIPDLCGVSDKVFALLLSLIPRVAERSDFVTAENKLLLFLVKMKHGVPFRMLGVLFGLHETTASRIFHAILGTLCRATRSWVYKPPLDVIKATSPACFRAHYPDCTMIVDCTEVKTEVPPEIRQTHNLYSTYKSGYTLKFLVAIAPNGMTIFKSEAFGGHSSDADISIRSGFLNLVGPGDVILADKGFPGIRASVTDKDAVLVMPPFSCGGIPFTPEEVDDTYHIWNVRVHVERAIQRLKIFGILTNRIPISLIPAMSHVFHMCCVLANLQPHILKKEDSESTL